jgi:UrcA family protein
MTYLTSIRMNTLRRSLPVALIVGSIAFMSARAHAADPDTLSPVQLDPITLSAPTSETVSSDTDIASPEERVTVTARVQADPAALTTEYGALMLNYSVRDAAHKACAAADPLQEDDTCVERAIESAKPQVDAAIARARSSLTG